MLMIGSTVMGGMGAIQQGNAAAASANYNAQVADMNAKLTERRARDALERGQMEEQQQRMKTSQIIGQQKAAMAANGVDLKFGSPLDTLVDTATMGELDALTIRANTYREERDTRQQANNLTGQASMLRAEAKSAKQGGFLNAFGTVLGGAAKAYSNYKMTA
jgi:hypothetical protein